MIERFAIAFLAAFALSWLATPLFGKIAFALNIIDHPSRKRFHLTSVPMLGGAAIATSFLILVGVFLGPRGYSTYLGILLASFLMLVLGLLDDIKGAAPMMKLAGQIIATIIMIATGLRVQATGILPIDIIFTFIWVCGIINAVNLLDNIDGLSSGTGAICAAFYFLFALQVGRNDFAYLPVLFSGCCMGFLFHNFHPGGIFMGDTGSMFLGTMLAGFGLSVAKPLDATTNIAAGVILGLIVFDTGLVSILRLANGRRLSEGGKDHTSHRLCKLGMSVPGAVTTLFAVNFFFGICALAMLKLSTQKAILIPFVLLLICLMCLYLLKDVFDYRREAA
jgi:UDP-GlcNAc:undecaprenyl-phosphate/decaprenyl-phosphate GlcNAc-1-phosphate transferase